MRDMFKLHFALLALLAVAVQPSAHAAKPVLELKPSSTWQVDYAEDRCRLIRRFGEGNDEMFAVFDRYGPSERFRLTVAGKPVRTGSDKSEAVIRFGPTEGEQRLSYYAGSLGDMPALIFHSQTSVAPPTPAEQVAIDRAPDGIWIDLPPISAEREGAIRHLTIGKPLRRPIVLAIGPMLKPLEALDKCVDNLMASWGIDVARHGSLSQEVKALTSPSSWVLPKDYPIDMLAARQPAIVEFRLNVGVDGKPTSCHIQSTTRPKEFDSAVCDPLMRRARFSPALDSAGKPLASFYQNTVRFAIP